jgi:hypothetical protein
MAKRGLALVAMGIVSGLAVAFGFARLIARLLYGVQASDPATFGAVAVLLGAVALGAVVWPARRASRLDVYVNVRIRRLVDDGSGRREEQTIAENISKGGARVLTSLNIVQGEVVEIQEVDGSFRARAEVRNAYVGQDHIPA